MICRRRRRRSVLKASRLLLPWLMLRAFLQALVMTPEAHIVPPYKFLAFDFVLGTGPARPGVPFLTYGMRRCWKLQAGDIPWSCWNWRRRSIAVGSHGSQPVNDARIHIPYEHRGISDRSSHFSSIREGAGTCVIRVEWRGHPAKRTRVFWTVHDLQGDSLYPSRRETAILN